MACSSIETARQLLINNVANSSGQVGKNLTSHFGITVLGYYDDLARRAAPHDEGTGYYHSLLTGMYWDKPHPEFDGTYQVQCGAAYTPSNWMVRDLPGYGAAFKRKLIEQNLGHAGMNMQATLLQTPKKFIDLDPVRKDRNGMPLPRVHLHYEQNDIRMAQDCLEKCVAIIEAGGGKVISRPDTIRPDNLVIDYNHWVGTARMGKDAKTSVVNTWGQSHDVKNLFVADAAVFPWYPEKNPVLTIAALSWRMSEHLAAEAKKGAL